MGISLSRKVAIALGLFASCVKNFVLVNEPYVKTCKKLLVLAQKPICRPTNSIELDDN